jgi:hypothetical protein
VVAVEKEAQMQEKTKDPPRWGRVVIQAVAITLAIALSAGLGLGCRYGSEFWGTGGCWGSC